MKKLYSLAIMLSLHVIANSQTTFQRLYSTGIGTSFAEASPTSDGGYIVCGSAGASSTDYLVSKLDANGQIQWAKHIGSWMGNETAIKIEQSVTGGYYLFGSTTSESINAEMNLILFDISGNILWNKTYSGGGLSNISSPSCRQNSSGEFILSATVYELGMYFLMIKTDTSGNMLWSKAYGADSGGTKEECYDVELCNDGGFIVIGDGDDTGIYAVKTDASGNMVWAKKYSTAAFDFTPGFAISKTSDGGDIISGMTIDYTSSLQLMMLTKIDASGNVTWSKKYTNPENNGSNSYSIVETPDNGFAMLSTTIDGHPELVKVNSSGLFLWSKHYTLVSYSRVGYNAIKNTPDGGFILTASGYDSVTYYNTYGYLIKTDPNGNTGCNDATDDSLSVTSVTLNGVAMSASVPYGASNTISFLSEDIVFNASSNCSTNVGIFDPTETNTDISIYLNPFSSSTNLHITTNNYSPEEYHFEMYDLVGRKIEEVLFSDPQLQIKRENLPAGIYIWKVSQGKNMVGKGKLVIE